MLFLGGWVKALHASSANCCHGAENGPSNNILVFCCETLVGSVGHIHRGQHAGCLPLLL